MSLAVSNSISRHINYLIQLLKVVSDRNIAALLRENMCPHSEGQYSVNGLICVVSERPTHLVISQSDQDDVWRVNPNL